MLQKELKLINLSLVLVRIYIGIKPNRTQNQDELKKVTKMVNENNLKHP